MGPVHEPLLHKGEVTPMTTKFWSPMWGLWQVDINIQWSVPPSVHYEQPLVSLPTSNPISWHRLATWQLTCKVIQKSISFTEKMWVNIWQFSKQLTTQHVTVYVCCHHKLCASLQLCVLGERTLPSYHWGMPWSVARWSIVFPGGTMAVDWLLTKEERKQPILGRTVCLDREVASDTTWDIMQICNVNSAHGVSESDICKCQGHVTFWVPGAWTLVIIKP